MLLLLWDTHEDMVVLFENLDVAGQIMDDQSNISFKPYGHGGQRSVFFVTDDDSVVDFTDCWALDEIKVKVEGLKVRQFPLYSAKSYFVIKYSVKQNIKSTFCFHRLLVVKCILCCSSIHNFTHFQNKLYICKHHNEYFCRKTNKPLTQPYK